MRYNKTEIHSNQFVVASVARVGGKFSMAEYPHIHPTYALALHEAQRLAGLNRGYKFVVLAVAAVAEVSQPVQLPVVTTYGL